MDTTLNMIIKKFGPQQDSNTRDTFYKLRIFFSNRESNKIIYNNNKSLNKENIHTLPRIVTSSP